MTLPNLIPSPTQQLSNSLTGNRENRNAKKQRATNKGKDPKIRRYLKKKFRRKIKRETAAVTVAVATLLKADLKRRIKNPRNTKSAIRNLNKIKVERVGLDPNRDRGIEKVLKIENTRSVIIRDHDLKIATVNNAKKRLYPKRYQRCHKRCLFKTLLSAFFQANDAVVKDPVLLGIIIDETTAETMPNSGTPTAGYQSLIIYPMRAPQLSSTLRRCVASNSPMFLFKWGCVLRISTKL